MKQLLKGSLWRQSSGLASVEGHSHFCLVSGDVCKVCSNYEVDILRRLDQLLLEFNLFVFQVIFVEVVGVATFRFRYFVLGTSNDVDSLSLFRWWELGSENVRCLP